MLVDEINRATPRTQAALLEAMQETAGHARRRPRHRLPSPFCVLATQNPIELEGTYPLPEAQLDRFMFKLTVPFPARESLRDMLDVSLDAEPSDTLQPIARPRRRAAHHGTVPHGAAGRALQGRGGRPDRGHAAARPAAPVRTPAGTSATAPARARCRRVVRAARVRAVMAGRAHVDVDDLEAVALPVLRHRILLRLESELDGLDADATLASIIDGWRRRL